MKIKTFKYIFMYIVIIISSIYIYNNFSSFSNYIKNYIFINKLDNLKEKNNVKITKIENIYSDFDKLISIYLVDKFEKGNLTGINKTDIANLYVLTEQLENAENIILNKNKYNYQDFYNLGNINLLKAYFQLQNNKDGYIENTQKAILNYNYALETIPSYKKKYFIVKNLDLAKSFLNYLYIYDCNKYFIKLISKNNNLLNIINNTKNIFIKQLKALKKWENYNEIKDCIKSFEEDAVNNLEALDSNIDFFSKTKKGLINLLKSYIDSENICYKNIPLFKQKYEKSITDSIKYFTKFYDKQNKLLKVFEKGKLKHIQEICNAKSKIAKNQKKENQQMQKNYNNLQDLTQQPKPDKNSENKKDKPQKNNGKKFEKKEIENMKELEKKQKETIEKIQKRKTKTNYNPMDYINRLFNGFYGNKQDYIDGKKENSIGK